jgi:hypothetical protein
MDTIFTEAFYSLQYGIGGLGGFRGTHRITSERVNIFPSYLPTFAIDLPPDESAHEPVVYASALLQTTQRKNERRLGFCPALQ